MQLSLKGGITCREAPRRRIVNPISERHYIVALDVPPSPRREGQRQSLRSVRGVRNHECELERYHLNSQQLTKTRIQSRRPSLAVWPLRLSKVRSERWMGIVILILRTCKPIFESDIHLQCRTSLLVKLRMFTRFLLTTVKHITEVDSGGYGTSREFRCGF